MKDSENNYIKTNKIPGYNELVESMETVAQEATLVNGIEEILSTTAKQGPDTAVTLTSVDEKIDGFYNTFDADIASQLQEIIGDSTTGLTGTTQTEEQVSTLRTLQESISDLASAMVSLVDSHVINNIAYNGVVFEDGYTPSPNMIEYLLNPNKIVEIYDDYTKTNTIGNTSFSKLKNLRKIQFSELLYAGASEWLDGCCAKEIYFDKLETIVSNGYYGFLSRAEIHKVYMPKLKTISYDGSGPFWGCTDLIDLIFGENVDNNISIPAWSPTNALSSSNSSLVESGETFANNLEKLLYNIREHIAANLPDRTGLSSLIITFSAEVKAAIQADQATADAFANKNWTVA